jgi:hypothetical protein
MRVFRSISRFLRGALAPPKSLMALARGPRPKSDLPTSKLYVLQVDFEVSQDALEALQKQLDAIRQNYGLDFMILEPGFKLRRFDDY